VTKQSVVPSAVIKQSVVPSAVTKQNVVPSAVTKYFLPSGSSFASQAFNNNLSHDGHDPNLYFSYAVFIITLI